MNKIIFWNAEHLSPRAADIAEDAAGKLDLRIKAAQTHATSWITRQKPTRATTRALTAKITKPGLRTERTEVNLYILLEETRKKAERLRNKLQLSEDLVHSAQHTFFCEVNADHPDARSPLVGGAAAGGATLCYAHYQGGVSTDFSNCPITDGWYVPGGAPIPAMSRVPRGVVINGSRGAAAGQAVRFCFWHAPSGNDGTIVAQMANGLDAGGHPFVLFWRSQRGAVRLRGQPRRRCVHPQASRLHANFGSDARLCGDQQP